MRVLIVDDERAARDRLAALVARVPDVTVVGSAGDGVEALAQIRTLAPDVVLLDIAMPEVNGFDVARHLPDPRPLVIFQTAYTDHALRAFEHDAVDYLLKPVTAERLARALDRARQRLAQRPIAALPADLLARIEAALAPSRPAKRTRILVRHGAGYRALAIRDVVRFTAEEGLVYAVTTSGRYLTDYTLGELESRLIGSFARANRADLVQIDRIDRITSNGDGSATLMTADGGSIHVSRRRAAVIRNALQ
jgi:DNA-binding LytR/AlgR family response regulator